MSSRHSDELEGHGPPVLAQAPESWQPLVHALGAALVGRALERAALLACPVQAAALAQPALQLVAERQQQPGIVGGVFQLLGGERPAVPLGEALGALQSHVEHLAHQ